MNQAFTLAEYEELLLLAKSHYAFVSYADYQKHTKGIFWRHDIDLSVHAALSLAQIEARHGIHATYFVHLHSPYYHFYEKIITDKLKEILGMGHHLGLHYSPAFYGEAKLFRDHGADKIELEKEIIEKVFNTHCQVFSYHNPTKEILHQDQDVAGMVNCYGKYFKEAVAYISDSNGLWKYKSLREILNDDNRPVLLQVLTHPVWWTKEYEAQPVSKVLRAIEGRAQDVRAHTLKNPFYK